MRAITLPHSQTQTQIDTFLRSVYNLFIMLLSIRGSSRE